MGMLQTHAPAIFSVIVFVLMRCVHTNTICMRFVLNHFQERFQIDAFSMKTPSVLVQTERLNSSKETGALRYHPG